MNFKNSKEVPYLILSLLVIAWGSSFILMKKGLESFTSGEVAAIRISSACMFLLPLAIRHFKNIPSDKWKYIALSGFIGYFIPAFLFTNAETVIDSSIAGILNSTTPLFALILGFYFFKLKTHWYNIIGIFVGLLGAVFLLYFSGTNNTNPGILQSSNFLIHMGYGALAVIAAFLYALNMNVIKTKLKHVNPTSLTVFIYLIIGPFAIGYLFFFTDFITHLTSSAKAAESFSFILILGIVCSALATIIYNYLIKAKGVLFSASVTYLMPIITIMWSLLYGEIFKLIYIPFIILILAGVYLVNYKSKPVSLAE